MAHAKRKPCKVCGGLVAKDAPHPSCRNPDDPGALVLNPVECAIYLTDPDNPRAGYSVAVTCNDRTLLATDGHPEDGRAMTYREAWGVAGLWCGMADGK